MFITPMTGMSTGQSGADYLEGSDRSPAGAFSYILNSKGFECSILIHEGL